MKRPGYKYLLFFLDGILINCSFYFGIRIHCFLTGTSWFEKPSELIPELFFWYACSAITMFVFITSNLYKINVFLSKTEQTYAIIKASSISLIAIAVIAYFGKSTVMSTSKLVLVSFYLLTVVSLLIGRLILFKMFFKYLCHHKRLHRNALIVGRGGIGQRIAEVLDGKNPFALDLVGVLDDGGNQDLNGNGGARVLGRAEDVKAVVRQMKIDEVIVCSENETDDRLLKVVESCTKTRARVLVSSPQLQVVTKYSLQERYDGVPMFGMKNSRVYMGFPFMKRIIDLLLGLVGVVLLLPVFISIAILIKLDSPGPVLFRQRRIGKNGIPFTFYKFRSMKLGSDNDPQRVRLCEDFIKNTSGESGESTKIVDENRVTRMGRFLRKSSLDELPQLFNVIRGDMSLVGPRPCLPYEWDHYAEWQKKRLSVTPGCTGLWQVMARSKVGFRDMVILDIFYANNISFHLDAWLILKTFPVMLFGNGGK